MVSREKTTTEDITLHRCAERERRGNRLFSLLGLRLRRVEENSTAEPVGSRLIARHARGRGGERGSVKKRINGILKFCRRGWQNLEIILVLRTIEPVGGEKKSIRALAVA